MSLAGIDVGSSGIRAVAFDHNGAVLAQGSSSYSVDTSTPPFVEVDPEDIWQAFIKAIRSLAIKVEKDPIESFAISSHGETFFLTDQQNQPVHRGIMNSDNRAVKQAENLESNLKRETIYMISGAPPHAMFPLAKIAWLREHRPKAFDKAHKLFCISDYLLMRMGLDAQIDASLACRTGLFDINSRKWSEKLFRAAGIESTFFPRIAPAGSVAGKLTSSCANILGLASGTAVIIGGHDQPCASLGLGVLTEGIVGDSAGSYECLSICDSKPHLGPVSISANLNSYCHVIPDRFITLAFFPSGIMMRWFAKELCGVDEKNIDDFYAELDKQASKNPSGLKVTPYLVGACNPHWDPNATASISGLTLASTRASIYRGILEGVSDELAANISVLEKMIGSIKEICISGGSTRSALGLRLRATTTNKEIKLLHTDQASCLGAAMLAGVGTGAFSSFETARKSMVQYSGTILP